MKRRGVNEEDGVEEVVSVVVSVGREAKTLLVVSQAEPGRGTVGVHGFYFFPPLVGGVGRQKAMKKKARGCTFFFVFFIVFDLGKRGKDEGRKGTGAARASLFVRVVSCLECTGARLTCVQMTHREENMAL